MSLVTVRCKLLTMTLQSWFVATSNQGVWIPKAVVHSPTVFQDGTIEIVLSAGTALKYKLIDTQIIPKSYL